MLADPDLAARKTPDEPNRVKPSRGAVRPAGNGRLAVTLPGAAFYDP